MIYSLKGQGKRRFLDPCDLVEAIQVLRDLRRSAGVQLKQYRVLLSGLITMLKTIREDLGVGGECILEKAVVMSNTRKKGGR